MLIIYYRLTFIFLLLSFIFCLNNTDKLIIFNHIKVEL
jgi:hypothetical protein